MRKILKIVKAVVFTSTIAALPIACTNTTDQNYTSINNISITTINAPVILNKDDYSTALQPFKAKVETEINKLLPKTKKPKYDVDYKITIANHSNIYLLVTKLELLNVKVLALNTSHILKGSFKSQVNLVAPRKDITSINITNQEEKVTINTTTFGETLTKDRLALIEDKIKVIAPTVKKDTDYVVNVEGHELSETITKLEPIHINVNAIEDDYHFLLHGNFTFDITLIKS